MIYRVGVRDGTYKNYFSSTVHFENFPLELRKIFICNYNPGQSGFSFTIPW